MAPTRLLGHHFLVHVATSRVQTVGRCSLPQKIFQEPMKTGKSPQIVSHRPNLSRHCNILQTQPTHLPKKCSALRHQCYFFWTERWRRGTIFAFRPMALWILGSDLEQAPPRLASMASAMLRVYAGFGVSKTAFCLIQSNTLGGLMLESGFWLWWLLACWLTLAYFLYFFG